MSFCSLVYLFFLNFIVKIIIKTCFTFLFFINKFNITYHTENYKTKGVVQSYKQYTVIKAEQPIREYKHNVNLK